MATSFEIVKQGDLYRLHYGAKNYATGLTNVTATPLNPSGASQTAIALTEIGSTGIYTADWDSAAKAFGVWTFIIDSPSRSFKAFTRLQVTDPDSLDDTMFEKMDTMLDQVITDVATVKTLVETVNSAVSGIQNNTKTTVALQEIMLVPGTGTNTYKAYVNVYDTNGNMEDPDDQDDPNGAWISVTVANSAGTSRTGNVGGLSGSVFGGLKWLTRESQGRFSFTYAVPDTHPQEDLIFTFAYEEGAIPRVVDRASRTSSSVDVTSIDSLHSKIDIIDVNVDDMIGNATYGLSALQTLMSAINSAMEDPASGLDAIKAALDHSTYGLSAIKSLIDTVNTAVGASNTNLTEIKGTGWVAANNLHNIYDLVQPGGIAM